MSEDCNYSTYARQALTSAANIFVGPCLVGGVEILLEAFL